MTGKGELINKLTFTLENLFTSKTKLLLNAESPENPGLALWGKIQDLSRISAIVDSHVMTTLQRFSVQQRPATSNNVQQNPAAIHKYSR